LINPHDPVAYGANSTGTTDSTNAIANALAAGDAYFQTPGTYLVNGGGNPTCCVQPPAGRVIECASGVTLKTTLNNGNVTGIFWINNPNVTVVGCDFRGPGPNSGFTSSGNNLIDINDTTGALIEGNTFENTIGDAAIRLSSNDGSGGGGSSSTVKYNTFTDNRVYSAAVTNGTNDTFNNNLSIRGSLGIECDYMSANPPGPCGHNTITNNQLTGGIGASQFGYYLNGGTFVDGLPSGTSYTLYSSDVVNKNYCSGQSSLVEYGLDVGDEPGLSGPATVSGNAIGSGCSCVSEGDGGTGC